MLGLVACSIAACDRLLYAAALLINLFPPLVLLTLNKDIESILCGQSTGA
jgi:hypothetical protein